MKAAKVSFIGVPYKGDAEVLTAMMGDQIDLYFTASQRIGKLISAGKLKGIAVASPRRAAVIPDVQTFAEAGMPDSFDLTVWFGLATTAGVPEEIIQRLNRESTVSLRPRNMRPRSRSTVSRR